QQNELERAVSEVERILLERRRQREYVSNLTRNFADRLFDALKAAIFDLRDRGLVELAEPRLVDHPAGGGRRALQIGIEDWGIIFVPLVGTARPNIRDEAQIPGAAFKQISGRIAVFIGSDPAEESFYDFIILSDGSWFAWGYGWPRQDSTIEDTDFKLLAYALMNSFIKDIFVTWRPRRDTTLGVAMDARKRAYVFGLPGDDA
ncbi:MAG: hypothetical protein K8J31_29945, partial [Anaerolineae bacterium]|nr:hypothetical protein [Anaerolineae bacterium]